MRRDPTASIGPEALRLVPPAAHLVRSYVEFLDEMAALGERVWPARPEPAETREGFVARLLRTDVAGPSGVPQTTYWATLAETVVGRIALRHRLNAELAEVGGHIGYEVRPTWRRRGVAKEMLRQVLRTAKAREIGMLLVTCAPDNVASSRAILANGGVLERTTFVRRVGRETSCYWIAVPPSDTPAS